MAAAADEIPRALEFAPPVSAVPAEAFAVAADAAVAAVALWGNGALEVRESGDPYRESAAIGVVRSSTEVSAETGMFWFESWIMT